MGATTNSMKFIWLPARLVFSRSHMGLRQVERGGGGSGGWLARSVCITACL